MGVWKSSSQFIVMNISQVFHTLVYPLCESSDIIELLIDQLNCTNSLLVPGFKTLINMASHKGLQMWPCPGHSTPPGYWLIALNAVSYLIRIKLAIKLWESVFSAKVSTWQIIRIRAVYFCSHVWKWGNARWACGVQKWLHHFLLGLTD